MSIITASDWFKSLDSGTRKHILSLLHIYRQMLSRKKGEGLILQLVAKLEEDHQIQKDMDGEK
jgi:hypothetical protein